MDIGSTHRTLSRTSPLWTVPATAVAYFLVGRIALLLAIPPGYAAPIWPAAAIALLAVLLYGRRCALGVWLGSMCVNASIGWPEGAGVVQALDALRVPFFIGAGAAGGGLLGAALIRRFVGFPSGLDTARQVIVFLALGGPVSCLVSPSVGVAALVIAGVVAPANAPFTWATWWVGDTLGVILFSLILLPFISGPERLWRYRRRVLPASLIVASVVMVALYVRTSQAEVRVQNQQFRDYAVAIQSQLQAGIQGHIEVLAGAAGLMLSRGYVTRDEFHRYATSVLARHGDVQALSWNPLVTDSQRAGLEAAARADGVPGFRITERDGSGALIAAGRRDRYMPIYFIEPAGGNEGALGFDLMSDAERAAAIGTALTTGRAAVTPPIQLVQDERQQPAAIVFMPVIAATESDPVSYGIVSGVFRLTDWAERGLAELPVPGMELTVSAGPDGKRVLYASSPASKQPYFSVRLPISVANGTWWLHASASQDFIAGSRSYVPWSILAGGLSLASLLGILLLTITGAQDRTRRANEQLRTMLDELVSTQSELVEAKRLVSLGAMVSGLAHELNTPLGVAITAASGMPTELGSIQRSLKAGELTQAQLTRALERWAESSGITMSNLRRAAELVRTFKSVVADRAVHTIREVDLQELIAETVEHLRMLDPGQASQISVELSLEPVTIETIPGSIVQLITNLYNNCSMHAFDGGPGTITITLAPEADGACIVFADDGKGIAADNLNRIFEPFYTTRRGEGGTGLGLHIVHNLVRHQLGGRIAVSSEPGQGTRFEIHLPRELGDEALGR